ncbi:MAG: ParB N-terminal domain-containing protein [Deltaproteobacteria bacterium]|nr:MAG: ParB N-terminal domain-containing protein [Deltaproteobacteria bacterium]
MDVLEMARENPITLDLKDIDENPGPCCMSFGFDLGPLIRSIEKFGLINSPVVAKEGEGRVDVVTGYRRILALKSLKWKKIPCRDLSESGLSPLQLLLFNLYDNLATREFNEVEKGMILNRLIPYVPREEITKDYMPLLDLPSHESTLDIFLKMEELEHPLKESLAKGRISLQAIKPLMETGLDSRSALFEWIMNLNFNFNQQLQFIEYTLDLSIKEEREISELLGQKQFSSILGDEKLNNPQKAKLVLDLLRSKRFPSLARSEKTFQKQISSLSLPNGTTISHPPYFEGSNYRLEVLFKHGKELKEKINALLRVSGLKRLGNPWEEEDL